MKNETKRSEKKSWNLFLMLALFLCAIFGIVALTYSWLTDSTDPVAPSDASGVTYEEASIGDFSYVLEYSFDTNNWFNVSSNGLGGVPVNYTDSSAPDYIGNLHYRVTQHGSIKSTARIKFTYQWFKTETLTTAHAGDEPSTARNAVQSRVFTLTPTLESGWYNGNDGYYYYNGSSSYVLPRETDVDICSGFSFGNGENPSDYSGQLRIIALLDGVQFNRYREVWDISSMPANS